MDNDKTPSPDEPESYIDMDEVRSSNREIREAQLRGRAERKTETLSETAEVDQEPQTSQRQETHSDETSESDTAIYESKPNEGEPELQHHEHLRDPNAPR